MTTGGTNTTRTSIPRRLHLLTTDRRWPLVDVFFTVVVILATTLGPVYQLRVRLGPVDGAFANDGVVVAAFGILYVGSAVLTARTTRRRNPLPISLTIAMTTLLVLSTLWSIDRPLTALQSLTALATLTIPWYLTKRWDTTQLVLLAWLAMFIGVVFSGLAQVRHWEGSVDRRGDWSGIYFNRNSLGPVAGLCALLGLWILITGVTRRDRRLDIGGRIMAGLSVLVAGVLLLRSGSKTSLFATMTTVLIAVVIITVVSVGRGRVRRWHIWTALGVVTALPLLLFSRVASVMGATPTLEGRTALWGYLWDKFWESPVTGKGWLATYSSLEYWHWGVKNLSTNVYSAHNGVFEVAVGAGIVALVALVIVLWMGIDHTLVSILDGPLQNAPMLLVMTFFLIENSGETFIGANHFLWILFLATCVFAWRSPDGVDLDEPTAGSESTIEVT